MEGYEGAVIDGMKSILSDPRIRFIGIEMHFGILEKRGESGQVYLIEQSLNNNNFTTHWTDHSHLIAAR